MRLLFLFAAALLTGCAGLGDYKVTVDSLAAPDALNHRAYILLPSMGNAQGLEYSAYASQVERALETKGLVRVDDPKKADAVVLFGYEVGSPVTSSYSRSIPQWGKTGYSGSQTYGSVIGNTYTSNTNYTPTYGVTGYQQVSGAITTYPLGIFLSGFTNEWTDKTKGREIWSVRISAGSKTPDLRSAFPFMLHAALPYIGSDTHGAKDVRVPKNTP